MTASDLAELLADRPPWKKLLGQNGLFLRTWREQSNPGAHSAWSLAHEAALTAEKSLKAYASTWGADGERLHGNLCALLAIRAGDLNLADRYAGREGQAQHWLNCGQTPGKRTVEREVTVPVAFTVGHDNGSIAAFRLSRLITPCDALWEEVDVALSLLGRELVRTLEECKPARGAFAWSLPEARNVALDGSSCGGAVRIAFRALEEKHHYRSECLILADAQFKGVGNVAAKLEAARLSGSIRRVLIGTGSDLDWDVRSKYRKLDPTEISSEQTAWELATQPLQNRPLSAVPFPLDRKARGVVPGKSPYVGPRPFSRDDAEARLFYRGFDDWWPLARLLSEPHAVILLCAPSGAGKTSLLNTMLRSSLEQVGIEVLPVARLNDVTDVPPPLNPYTAAAIESMISVDERARIPSTWSEYLASLGAPGKSRLLIIDQLEEIITGPSRSENLKYEFFVEIRKVIEEHPWLRVLFCFRAECLFDMEQLLGEYRQGWQRYPLSKIGFQDARDAIERPALEQYGVEYDPFVVDELLKELGSGDVVEPTQLQIACQMLWNRLPGGIKRISMDHVRLAVEGVASSDPPVRKLVAWANDNFCSHVIQQVSESALAPDNDPFPRELAELGLSQFIDGGRRIAVFEGGAFTGSLPTSLVEQMARFNLLRWEKRLGRRMFELAHDRLIAPVSSRTSPDDASLVELFRRSISKAAASCGVDQGLVTEEFLLTFIADDGSRVQVSKRTLEVGASSLSVAVIQSLESSWILRPAREDSQDWVEICCPQLSDALFPLRRAAFSPKHRTRRNLANHIEEAKRAYADDLRGCFQSSAELVADIDRWIGFGRLSWLEAAFVLRAGLASRNLLDRCATQIGSVYPDLARSIVLEAAGLTGSSPRSMTVRANAARALRVIAIKGRAESLLSMALDDSSAEVRKAAALTLAKIDDPTSWRQLEGGLSDASTRERAEITAAWIRDATHAGSQESPRFETWWANLSPNRKRRIQRRLAVIRIEDAWSRILLGTAVAVLSTTVFVAPMRAILGAWGLTVTQLSTGGANGFAESGFLGIVGAVIWGSLIGGALLSWWFVGEGRAPYKARHPAGRAAIVGGMAGLMGGAIITTTLTFVYGSASLTNMGWIVASLSDPLTKTGLAYALPFSGLLVGILAAAVVARLVPSWETKMMQPLVDIAPLTFETLRTIYAAACRHALGCAWMVVLPMVCGAIAFRFVLTGMLVVKREPGMLPRLVGDFSDVAFGGVGLIAGILLAMFVLGKGFSVGGIRVSGEKQYSLLATGTTDRTSGADDPVIIRQG